MYRPVAGARAGQYTRIYNYNSKLVRISTYIYCYIPGLVTLMACLIGVSASNLGEYTIILRFLAFLRPFQEVSRYYATTTSFHSLSSSLPTVQYRVV